MIIEEAKLVFRCVDPRKLDECRGAIEFDLAQEHIENNFDFRYSCVRIASNLTGRDLYCSPAPGGFWIAWTDAPENKERYRGAVRYRAGDGSTAVSVCPLQLGSDAWLSATADRCWACSETDAILAASLLCINPEEDVFYSELDVRRYLPKSSIEAVRSGEAILSNQPLGIRVGDRLEIDQIVWTVLDRIVEQANTSISIVESLKSTKEALDQEVNRHLDALRLNKIGFAEIPSPLNSADVRKLEIAVSVFRPMLQTWHQVNVTVGQLLAVEDGQQ